MKADNKPIEPLSREAHKRALAFLRSMTPEELLDFMEAGVEGVEQTDRTGHFPINPERPILASSQSLQKKSA